MGSLNTRFTRYVPRSFVNALPANSFAQSLMYDDLIEPTVLPEAICNLGRDYVMARSHSIISLIKKPPNPHKPFRINLRFG
jgi:hypothetical protein